MAVCAERLHGERRPPFGSLQASSLTKNSDAKLRASCRNPSNPKSKSTLKRLHRVALHFAKVGSQYGLISISVGTSSGGGPMPPRGVKGRVWGETPPPFPPSLGIFVLLLLRRLGPGHFHQSPWGQRGIPSPQVREHQYLRRDLPGLKKGHLRRGHSHANHPRIGQLHHEFFPQDLGREPGYADLQIHTGP